jgi:hypothetical protein
MRQRGTFVAHLHCFLSRQRFHFCFETLRSRTVSRVAALLTGSPEAKGSCRTGFKNKISRFQTDHSLDARQDYLAHKKLHPSRTLQ